MIARERSLPSLRRLSALPERAPARFDYADPHVLSRVFGVSTPTWTTLGVLAPDEARGGSSTQRPDVLMTENRRGRFTEAT